jgi:hypothetical protein
MSQWIDLNCERYGHLITAVGRSSSKVNGYLMFRHAEQIALPPQVAHLRRRDLGQSRRSDWHFQTAEEESPVRRILVQIDAAHVKPPT